MSAHACNETKQALADLRATTTPAEAAPLAHRLAELMEQCAECRRMVATATAEAEMRALEREHTSELEAVSAEFGTAIRDHNAAMARIRREKAFEAIRVAVPAGARGLFARFELSGMGGAVAPSLAMEASAAAEGAAAHLPHQDVAVDGLAKRGWDPVAVFFLEEGRLVLELRPLSEDPGDLRPPTVALATRDGELVEVTPESGVMTADHTVRYVVWEPQDGDTFDDQFEWPVPAAILMT